MEQSHTHTCKTLLISILCSTQFAFSLSSGQDSEEYLTGSWVNHGGDIYNSRSAQGERKISPATVSRLRLKWKFNAGNDISATPAICDGVVYFPSWNGYIYAVRAGDGSLVWKKSVQQLTGLNSTTTTAAVARATPTVAGDKLIVGISGPAYVFAVERATGELVWQTELDKHPAAVITMSGTFHL